MHWFLAKQVMLTNGGFLYWLPKVLGLFSKDITSFANEYLKIPNMLRWNNSQAHKLSRTFGSFDWSKDID